MVYNVFRAAGNLTKLDFVSIDNAVFRLHYKLTVIFLFSSSILVTSNQYFGEPISCIQDEVPSNILDNYCWMHATFTLPEALDKVWMLDQTLSSKCQSIE